MPNRLPNPQSLSGTLWTGRERDACGMGFIARRDAQPTRAVVELALDAVERLAHRGAVDAGGDDHEPTGDGAGLLTEIPWGVLDASFPGIAERGRAGDVGVGMCFLPLDATARDAAIRQVEHVARQLQMPVLGWRDVPLEPTALGAAARATAPHVAQVLLERPEGVDAATFPALLYRARREIDRRTRRLGTRLYLASLSPHTVVYKGLMVADQLRRAYPDLADPRYISAWAVFHQRFSTNTFPAWERAQPCRMLAHNGEINTLRGNTSWMRARGEHLGWRHGTAGPGDDGHWLVPVIDEDGSDSAMLDDVAQLVSHAGRSLPDALTLLVPPAWDHDQDLRADVRDLLRRNAAMSEPWDGPAAIAFADGRHIGACLDRNGLRPARWLETTDGMVACASEAGAVSVPDDQIARTGRLGPGQMLVVDLADGSLRSGDEVVHELATTPWGVLVAAQQVEVPDSATPGVTTITGDDDPLPLAARQALFGYSREELTAVLRPMVQAGSPAIGSMGDDTPLAALAPLHRSLFGFVRQSFAEVTNPPIDPLREAMSMSLDTMVGPRARLLSADGAARPLLRLRSPLLTRAGLAHLRERAEAANIAVVTLQATWASDRSTSPDTRQRIELLCDDARRAVRDGADVIVISDRDATPDHPPIPALLAASAVHQSLVRDRRRTRVGLIIDTGEARDAHHVAALLGHGADAVCPWLALDTAVDLAEGPRSRLDVDGVTAQARLLHALEYGLRTAMSRMGISTLDGYRGAHVFEVVGLDPVIADRHFTGTTARPGNVAWGWIAAHSARNGAAARSLADGSGTLESPGFYKFRRGGEQHAFEPAVVAALHAAVGVDEPLTTGFAAAQVHFRRFAELVHERPAVDPRDLLQLLRPQGVDAVPIDEVESARAIVRRFSTGAMSHGSLSAEAHEALAAGTQLIGASSNSGEGGEDPHRYGTNLASRIKQVASGRFGVTPAYLRSADELQIKMAQGSKPGEGGQLPGHKVTDEIARIRHTRTGVSLISPPPHHDIYSIEDLAQLSYDLASVHPAARISVKLVSQAGVGTIAAGVAKARVGTIVISGADGGTGASPLASIKHAGMPWEWGLAESQQVLVANRLRGRVRLRVDGGLRTGRDVVIGAILGADEFSFGTSALIAVGCKMARTCHNDQCPVGIATQNPALRELFPGRPDQLATYLLLVAEEVRELLAMLGARTLEEVIGRPALLHHADTSASHALDLGPMLAEADVHAEWPRSDAGEANRPHGVDESFDTRLAADLAPYLAPDAAPVTLHRTVDNRDRSIGARVSGDIAQHVAANGLEPGAISLELAGTCGQSLAAFAIRGLRINLVGIANDFVGKGLAGADVVLRFPDGTALAAAPGDNVIAGNACLYGATSGSLLAAGGVGERFAVRNSGATAVIEGAGDHLCEYMTDGVVVVLGSVGRNIASGMSGGSLWLLDAPSTIDVRLPATAAIAEPTDVDLSELRRLVELHAARTGSALADDLLDSWGDALERFVLVEPAPVAPVA
ncbi:MAG: hypothetical protein JWM90_994 [Thermoleophilia bacterium]|nr:hypothetical protein [Thermoleophilia bacterium]